MADPRRPIPGPGSGTWDRASDPTPGPWLTGDDHPWLVEHARNGLPTLDELQQAFAVHEGPIRFAFHGDFREVDAQFRRIVLARHRHRPGDVLSYAAFRLPYRPGTALSDTPSPYANRVFVIADRARS